MVHVTRLAHVGLQAQCLSNQAEFYNDRWGLERVDEFGGEMFFRADGPDHRKRFEIEVVVGGETIARAEGRAKKEAEQLAARDALAKLKGLSGEGAR